jgi:hypothetical protein
VVAGAWVAGTPVVMLVLSLVQVSVAPGPMVAVECQLVWGPAGGTEPVLSVSRSSMTSEPWGPPSPGV